MSLPSYSYSTISAAYKCLKYYKLLYVDRIEVPGIESAALKFGSAMHAGLEAMLSNMNAQKVFDLVWDPLVNEPMEYYGLNHPTLKDMGHTFLERFADRYLDKIEVVQMEQRLYGSLGDIKLEGTPDVIGLYNGIPSIIDFKTSAKNYPAEKIEINEQMFLYAHLAKQSFGFEAKQLVYFVFVKDMKSGARVQRPLTLQITDAKMSSMLHNVELMCKELEGRVNYPANRNSCMMGTYKCDFYNVCYPKEKGLDYGTDE